MCCLQLKHGVLQKCQFFPVVEVTADLTKTLADIKVASSLTHSLTHEPPAAMQAGRASRPVSGGQSGHLQVAVVLTHGWLECGRR